MPLRAKMSEEVNEILDLWERSHSCTPAFTKQLTRALNTRVKAGELLSPCPRLYVRASTWAGLSQTQRTAYLARGLHELHPYWVFCGPTAAVLWGLSVPYRMQGAIHLADTPGSRFAGRGIMRVHTYTHLRTEYVDDVPVTPLLQTVFDCARASNLPDGAAVADSALHTGRITKEQLVGYVEGMRGGYRGAAQARVTAAFADARSANGGESIARATMWQLGFAAPDLQYEVQDPIETWRSYYADYAWRVPAGPVAPARLIIGELDGVEKIVDAKMNGGAGPLGALLKERKRESRLTAGHASVMRFSMGDVLDLAGFNHLLEAYGVPKDHKPTVRIPPYYGESGLQVSAGELVPLEAYSFVA